MPDYIERGALTNSLDELCDRVCLYSKKNRAVMCSACPLGHAFDLVEDIPAANVREVVLCRDCKHNMANIPDIQDGININENWNACQLTELYDSVKPDDFCSRGEKRGES